jgi:hypothetical protein
LHLAREALWYMMRLGGQAQYRRSRLNSNVRRHRTHHRMHSFSDYDREPRGARLVEIWRSRHRLETELGCLPIELCCPLETNPTHAMIDRASELAAFVRENSSYLLDIVYAHYRYAEANDWLSFWNVPPGLARGEVLQHVDEISLVVFEDLFACVHVDPRWDPEHKLSLDYDHAAVQRIDGQAFELVEGKLVFR